MSEDVGRLLFPRPFFPAKCSSSARYNTTISKIHPNTRCHFDPNIITGTTKIALTMKRGTRSGGGVAMNPIAINVMMLTTKNTQQIELRLNIVIISVHNLPQPTFANQIPILIIGLSTYNPTSRK